MRALVTGSHGFIGSNLVKRLKDEGHEVWSWDKKIGLDILELADDYEPVLDVIYHLACVNQMAAALDPAENIHTNIGGTYNVAELARRTGAKIIYTSTASVYGAQPDFNIPTSTLHYVNPQSDYAIAKLAGEWFVRNSGADYTILRLSNVYGPGQTVDNPYCGVVGRFFDQALMDEPIPIIGDGSQTRDFTFVDDVVNWLLVCGKGYNNPGPYNVSTGVETTIQHLAAEVSRLCVERGTNFAGFKEVPERPVDGIKRRCLIPDLMCPTDLTTGLKATLNWLGGVQK